MKGHLAIAEALLKGHEGKRLKPYRCTAGKLTIGYGRNLEDRGISQDEALALLANDIYACEEDLQTFAWWPKLTDNQKAALIDLRFCVGGFGFRKFEKMLAALDAGDVGKAADEIIDSRFAKQTGDRAQDLADLMKMAV